MRKSQLKRFEANLLGSLFILKIIKARPEGVDLSRWTELIFGLHERDIIQYRVLKKFYIPGFYKPAPQVRISGYKIHRSVTPEQRIWVRFDMKYPNVIDLEAPIAIGSEARVFQLSRHEWDFIKKSLHPVHREDKSFDRTDRKLHKNVRSLKKRNATNPCT